MSGGFAYTAYRFATRATGPWLRGYLGRRAAQGKEDASRIGERFGRSALPRPAGKLIWVHAASVGESLSALPLLRSVLDANPDAHAIFTSGTVTSAVTPHHPGAPPHRARRPRRAPIFALLFAAPIRHETPPVNDPRGHRHLPYHPDAYDEHFALRIPATLWLILVYAAHVGLFVLIAKLPHDGIDLGFITRLVDNDSLVAALPAILVLFAAIRRRPAAGRGWRLVWRYGRGLLMLSVALNLALLGRAIADGVHSHLTDTNAVRIALDLFSLCVLAASGRIRDTFADFPRLPV